MVENILTRYSENRVNYIPFICDKSSLYLWYSTYLDYTASSNVFASSFNNWDELLKFNGLVILTCARWCACLSLKWTDRTRLSCAYLNKHVFRQYFVWVSSWLFNRLSAIMAVICTIPNCEYFIFKLLPFMCHNISSYIKWILHHQLYIINLRFIFSLENSRPSRWNLFYRLMWSLWEYIIIYLKLVNFQI